MIFKLQNTILKTRPFSTLTMKLVRHIHNQLNTISKKTGKIIDNKFKAIKNSK